jgi:8-oxo-dGTP pyrophosphatase MutT (NUDIX family)
MSTSSTGPSRGIVALVVRDGRLLVIQRSQQVRAPGTFCFPGGAIEPGETEAEAVVRELAEELSLPARAVGPLWTSVTPWGVSLAWWLADVEAHHEAVPNPQEVAACWWLSVEEIRRLPDLLSSNLEFLAAWAAGDFCIEGLPKPEMP